MEHWYHPKGFHCLVCKEEDKEILKARGWQDRPFDGVGYAKNDFTFGGVMPFGMWVLKTPVCPKAPEHLYVDAKGNYTEEYRKLKEAAGEPIKKRGRPKKAKE